VAAALLCGAGPGAAQDTRKVDETRPLQAGGRFHFETISGEITVRAWDRNEVSIQGEIGAELELRITGGPDNVRASVEWPDEKRRRVRNEEVRLEIRLPVSAELSAESVSAPFTIAGLDGPIEVQTVSGSIQVDGGSRRVRAQSVSGDITAEVAAAERVEIENVSGEIRIRTGGGEVDASTVSGSLSVDGGRFETLRLESVSGNLEVLGGLAPNGTIDISGHSGSIDVGLRGDVSARVRVTTFSGGIRSDFGGSPERTSNYGPGKEYETTLGSGSGRIDIEAFSGEATLRRL